MAKACRTRRVLGRRSAARASGSGARSRRCGPSGARTGAPHTRRPEHDARHPVHVTIRVAVDIDHLRKRDIFRAFRAATLVTARREDFHIVHMSIQGDRAHLIVEAEHKLALSRGMQGFQVSAAKRINAAIGNRTGQRRAGAVFPQRYHARALTSPCAVRGAIVYVLNSWRLHGEDLAPSLRTWRVDPYSTGVYFPDWKELEGSPFLYRPPAGYQPFFVWRPRTWLLGEGWLARHGRISTHELPILN
ncbi:MAG: transposase [Kofleriaceae bacterium]